MSPDEWHDVIDVHLHGTFNMTKAAIDHLNADGGGSIVNMSSIAAICGTVGQTNYGAAKGGVLAFTRCIARELQAMRFNVRANAILAGLIETDMTRDLLGNDRAQQQMCTFIPMRKAGEPEDIAEMVYYLASDKAKYITGASFQIDGGLTTGFDG